MKITITALAWLLIALLLLLPAGVLICSGLGYVFRLDSYPLFAALPAVCGVFAFVLRSKAKPDPEMKTARTLFSLSAPLAVIAAAFYMRADPGVWTLVCCLVSIAACVSLAIAWGRQGPFKTCLLSVTAVLAVAVGAFCFICLFFENFPFFGSFGASEVVRRVDSPSGSYVAEIIADDQGALGGATWVEVSGTNRIDVWLIHIEPVARRVYTGPWGEFETMELSWKNDACLEINGKDYRIP